VNIQRNLRQTAHAEPVFIHRATPAVEVGEHAFHNEQKPGQWLSGRFGSA
jgi:hypothetical protein